MLLKKKLLWRVLLIFCVFLLYSCKGGVSDDTDNTASKVSDADSADMIFENPNPVKKIDQKAIQNTLSEKLGDGDFIKEVVEVGNREQIILDRDFFEEKYGPEYGSLAVSYYSFLIHNYDKNFFNLYSTNHKISLSPDDIIESFEEYVLNENEISVYLIRGENEKLLKYMQEYRDMLESEKQEMVDIGEFSFLESYDFIEIPDIDMIKMSDMYDIVRHSLDDHFTETLEHEEYAGMSFEDFLDSIEIK